MTNRPNVLWVYAHPDRNSLNAALRDHVVSALQASSWNVTVDDLYAEKWDPVLSDGDVASSSGATLSDRQRAATLQQTLPSDVLRRQDLVRNSGLVVVQFPLWWYGMPAILKGWFDRVFTNGFAFGIHDEEGRVRKYGDGNLIGRRLLPVVTAGDRAGALSERGISGPIDDVLWPLLHGTAHYTGMSALRTHLVADANRVVSEDVAREVDRLIARMNSAFMEEPIPYRSLRGGDYSADHILQAVTPADATGLRMHRRPTMQGTGLDSQRARSE